MCVCTHLCFSPAYAVPKILEKNGLKVEDIDVWELHEAFAVICVLFLTRTCTYMSI